jgi:hypothetical protein
MPSKGEPRPRNADPNTRTDADPDRVSLAPLDPVKALKGLLAVDPDSKPAPQGKHRKKKPAKKG